jgi:glycosyltransferase involved in cell wall biosynthesis
MIPSEKPLISIVIAAYKNDFFLKEAIRSALNQSYPHFELIVSDDAASESTQSLVESFADTRCRYRKNAQNLGSAGNHLAAFAEAKGTFISILNHDDRWQRDFLARLIQPLIVNEDIAVSFCDHWVMNQEGTLLKEETDQTTRYWKRDQLAPGVHCPFDNLLLDQTIPLAMGAIFRRSVLPSTFFSQSAGPAYDLWLTYLLCASRKGAYYVPDRLSHWRIHPQNLTSQGGLDWCLGSSECWLTITRDPRMKSIHKQAHQKYAASICALAKWHLRRNHRFSALKYSFQAVWERFNWQSLSILGASLLPKKVIGWLAPSFRNS